MEFVICPSCRNRVPADFANTGQFFPCGGCNQPVLLDVFPAARRPSSPAGGGTAADGVAACFFHDERAAQAACDGCGRYLCALCDVPVGREHLCPECLAARHRRGTRQTVPNERIAWDRLALLLATLPLLLWPFTIVTAPTALFLVVRFWRAPGSLVGRSWPRMLIAGLLALAQVVGWAFGIAMLIFA
jgi:hypothetical protein